MDTSTLTSGGEGVLSLFKNMGQVIIESFLEWAKKGFPLGDNAEVLDICTTGESEETKCESGEMKCYRKSSKMLIALITLIILITK